MLTFRVAGASLTSANDNHLLSVPLAPSLGKTKRPVCKFFKTKNGRSMFCISSICYVALAVQNASSAILASLNTEHTSCPSHTRRDVHITSKLNITNSRWPRVHGAKRLVAKTFTISRSSTNRARLRHALMLAIAMTTLVLMILTILIRM